MAWDPDSGETFGQYARGGAPLGGRTADVVIGECTNATKDQVVEGTREDGTRFQERTDQAGATITRETSPAGRERQHVRIPLR